MGLLLGQFRLSQINSQLADLQYKVQLVSTTKMELTSQVDDILTLSASMDSKSPEAQALEKKKERLNQVEKKLDMQLQRYQTQINMLESEKQSVKESVNRSIQGSYG